MVLPGTGAQPVPSNVTRCRAEGGMPSGRFSGLYSMESVTGWAKVEPSGPRSITGAQGPVPSAGASTVVTEIFVVAPSAPAGKSRATDPSAVVTSPPPTPTEALPPGARTATAP